MAQQLIDNESRQALKDKFAQELRDDVQLKVFVGDQNPEYGDFAVQLVKELNELDGRIRYDVLRDANGLATEHGVSNTPSILIGWDKGYRVRYTGAPVGHEAAAFIETISLISRGESGLSKATEEKLSALDQDVKLQVFVTPTCPYCPQSVLLANRIAIAAKGKVTAEAVEATENMKLSEQFNVSSVPQQVINEDLGSTTIGAQPEGSFVDSVLSYGSSRYAEIKAKEEALRAQAERLVDSPEQPVKLTDRNFDEALKKYPNLVVDCWAEWCSPCRMVAPVIEDLAVDYRGKVVFGKLDVDHNQAVSSRHQIVSIPTLLFFKDGKLAGTQVGALPKSSLDAAVKKNFGL